MKKVNHVTQDTVSNGRATSDRRWKAKFTEYVNFTPSDAQKDAFDLWATDQNYWDLVADACARGFRISTEFDDYNRCFQASIFCKDQDSINAGRVCTGRGYSPEIATFRVMFYVSNIFPEDWKAKVVTMKEDRW